MKPYLFSPASLLVAALLASACGGATSTPGSGTVSGSVAGVPISVASEYALSVPITDSQCVSVDDGGETCTSTSEGNLLEIALTNRSEASCGAIQSEIASRMETSFANMKGLAFVIQAVGADVTPGTYAIVSPGTPSSVTNATIRVAVSEVVSTNATCQSNVDGSGTSGTLTLNEVSSSRVTGSFDVTYGSEGHLTGSFDVAMCDAPVADAGLSRTADGGVVCR